MTCSDVRRFWDRRLDALEPAGRSRPAPDLEPEIAAHLETCARCRAISDGYAALDAAIGALKPSAPPERLADRILEAWESERSPASIPIRRPRPKVLGIAAVAGVAAALLIAVLIGQRTFKSDATTVASRPPEADPPTPKAPPKPFDEAVGEAAEATLAIARRTSEPAARLGRDVLDSAATLVLASEVPPPISPSGDGAATLAVRTLGDRIGDGVRPLARPTRSAFGFLLPRLPRAEAPPDLAPERGA